MTELIMAAPDLQHRRITLAIGEYQCLGEVTPETLTLSEAVNLRDQLDRAIAALTEGNRE